MKKELYSPKETAEMLGVSVLTLQRRDNSGKINAVRTPNGRRRFPKSEIITSFSGRLYGTRSSKNKVLKDKVREAIEYVANLPDENQKL